MKLNKINRLLLLEIIISLSAITVINLIFKSDPGFAKIDHIPYMVIPIIVTVYSGRRWGMITLALSTLYIIGSIFLINSFFLKFDSIKLLKDTLNKTHYIVATNVFIMYVTSVIVGQLRDKIIKLEDRMKKLSLEVLHYKRSTNALHLVNKEFELRLSKTQESITRLYNQIEKLARLNSSYILQTYLETIVLFTKTSKATVWAYAEDKNMLQFKSSIGYYKEEPGPFLNVENSVEGFVFRNNQFFSIRNIKDFQSIKIHYAKYNIITIPINIGRKVWGVLNIEELPFEKYSRYTEQLLHIITNLTEPYLEKAIEFEGTVKKNDLDTANNIPFYTQFYSLLEDQLISCWKSKSSLSIIIFELLNYNSLTSTYMVNDIRKIFTNNIINIFKDAGHDFYFFNFKNSNQIALLSTNLDFDGVSYYCVKAFKKFSEAEFLLHESKINLDICIGYATQKEELLTTDGIITQAETLLNMAKL